MTESATTAPPRRAPTARRHRPRRRAQPERPRVDRAVAGARCSRCLGALVFLFPFYYMLIGSLQAEPDTSVGRRLPDSAT